MTYSSLTDFNKDYDYDLSREDTFLGRGTYGRVVKARSRRENRMVALKISEFNDDDARSLRAEVERATTLPIHSNIAHYEACYRIPDSLRGTYDYAIMQLYEGGNLANLIKKSDQLSDRQRKELVRGILLGLKHLHDNKLIHRDLKPANILIDHNPFNNLYVPLIADFGLSRIVQQDTLLSSNAFGNSDGRGTLPYKAPEQFEGEKVSFNLDLWAFGVILYELQVGTRPFWVANYTENSDVARQSIQQQIIAVQLPADIDGIAEPYQSIIRRCLVKDIRQRVRTEAELLDLLDGISQLLDRARAARQQENYRGAEVLLEQVLQLRPSHAQAQKEMNEVKKAKEQAQRPITEPIIHTDLDSNQQYVNKNEGGKEQKIPAKLSGIELFIKENLSYLTIGALLAIVSFFVLYNFFLPSKPKLPQGPVISSNLLTKIQRAGVLRVAVETDAAPFNWQDEETGEEKGFERELAELIAGKLRISQVKIIWVDNYSRIPYLIKPEVDSADIFMGGYVPDPKLQWVEWSKSYLEENGYCLIVREGKAISSLNNLNNPNSSVLIYNEEASRNFVEKSLPELLTERIVIDEDNQDRNWLIRHLVDVNDADAAIYDYPFANQEVREANEILAKEGKPKLKIVQFNLNTLAYSVGLPGPSLVSPVNKAIDEIIQSKEYKKLVKKYLDFDASSIQLTAIPRGVPKHFVVAGESLSIIAQRELGNINRWQEIWDLNKNRVPNSNLIREGSELIMPE